MNENIIRLISKRGFLIQSIPNPPPPPPPCAPSNEIRPHGHERRIFSIKVQISMIFAVRNQIFDYTE